MRRRTKKFSPRCWRWTCRHFKPASKSRTRWRRKFPNLVLRRFLLKNLGRDAAGGFFWKINLRGIAENYAQLRRAGFRSRAPFAKPALFIRGGKSNYIKVEDEPLIRELFPQAEIQTIAGASHWVHADQPEKFLRLVSEFFD